MNNLPKTKTEKVMAGLYTIFGVIDQTVDSLRERHPKAVKCVKGCADCCSAVFDVSFVEAANLLRAFISLPGEEQAALLAQAEIAKEAWNTLTAGDQDPAEARIRCPLLNEEGICSCYEARPVNCRTYGVPTAIKGAAHVCGLSAFDKGKTYSTIQLDQLQTGLFELSCELTDAELGRRRYPVAVILLNPAPFSLSK